MKDLEDGDVSPNAEAPLPSRDGKSRGGGGHARKRKNGGRAAQAAGADGAPRPPGARKRHKRRRGRKVFAREGARPDGAAAGPVAAGLPPRPPEMPPSRPPAFDPALAPPDLARPATPSAGGGIQPPAVTSPLAGATHRPRRAGVQPGGPAYAALDLGTNNCRLLVAVPTRPGQFRVVDAFSRIVRLGEGLSASGRLGEQAMRRAIDALGVCADKLAARRIRKARLIATEACRAAENGADFIGRVRDVTGLELEIIDRETEARLAVSGCGSLVEPETRGVVLFDIGGGSSEIALIDISAARSGRLANHIAAWTSLPVGVVSLSERFGGRHVTPTIFGAMVDDVGAMLAGFEGRGVLGDIARGDGFHLIGTSGTVTTLAGIHLELPRYDRRRVDGLWMEGDDVDRMIARLLGWEFHERVANPCIGADRADLVLAGCAILEAIRRVWPSRRLRVADRGLREGILSELMAEDGAWERRRGGPRP